MRYRVTVQGRSFEIEVDHDRLVRVNGHSLNVELEQIAGLPLYTLALDGEGHVVFVEEGQDAYRVEVQGQVYPVEVQRKRPQLATRQIECAEEQDCLAITAPLAGNLVSLLAAAGERIEARQPVAIVESMKMQMEIKAPAAGVVKSVCGPPVRRVSQGEELVVLKPIP